MIWVWSILRSLVVLAGVALLFVIFAVAKVAVYEQYDDAEHLQAKQAYLESLRVKPTVASRPNIVFVLYDDLGFGDIGHYGATLIKTPNLDAIAAQGVSLDAFYSPAPVCTPARAAFLTGRFAHRAGLAHVVFPDGHLMNNYQKFSGLNVHLPREEVLLPEILKAVGYRTGMVGKWHLGDVPGSRPWERGFETYYGALYSNDMLPFALYRNGEVAVESPADQTQMDALYTDEASRFIRTSAGQPFFLYFAHNFPHIPLYAPAEREGQSAAGLYGDVIEQLDASLGRLLAVLDETGQRDNTLIIITSDNGPWYQGDPGPHRGRKGSVREGGMRVPFIAHWPGKVAGGQRVARMASGVDIVPMVLEILGLPAPQDRQLDGEDLLPVLQGEVAKTRRVLPYFASGKLLGLRDERYKFFANGIPYQTAEMKMGFRMPKPDMVFDLQQDRNESWDISLKQPAIRQQLQSDFNAIQSAHDSNPRGWIAIK